MITSRTESKSAAQPHVWAVSEYYQPNFSGAAIQAHRILSRLAARGLNVDVLAMADQEALELAGQEATADDVTIKYVPVIRRRSWGSLPLISGVLRSLNELFRQISFDLRVARWISRHGKRDDIVQFYVVSELTWLIIWLARRKGMHPIIQISLVGADDPASFRSSLFGLSTRMKRSCFYAAERVIGLSTALTRSCEQVGVSDSVIVRIPNGVDLETFQTRESGRAEACARLGFDPDRKRAVFVGSAIHRKGIDVVVPAFIQLSEQFDDVDLVVVGPCDFSDHARHDISRQELVDNLRKMLDEKGLGERVHWVGEVNNVNDYLMSADVFFFPTRREGLPNALAEAMAAGLPVVVSRIDGVTTDLVQDGVEGRLVDGYDPEPYGKALTALFGDTPSRGEMAHAARQRIERDFELSRIVARYEDLYNSVRAP